MSTENKSDTPIAIRDLWQTPLSLFHSLDLEFDFECDVASSNDNKLCLIHYTEKDNALNQEWLDSNWCNPPYSDISPWVEKAIEQHRLGKTTVMLVPSDTSVKWFKRAFESCNEVRFISGRLSFVNAATQKPVNGNNKGSVLFIWKAYAPTSSHSVSLINRDDLITK